MVDSNKMTAQREAVQKAERQLDQIFFNVFEGHPDGQRILLDLQGKFCDRTSVMGSPVDAYGTMVREGERNVLLYIHGRIFRFQESKK